MNHTLSVIVEDKPGVLARFRHSSQGAVSTSTRWPLDHPTKMACRG